MFSVLGLAAPVSQQSFSDHTKYLESLSCEIRDENLKMAAARAKSLVAKETNSKLDENIDVPTSFDGSWSSRGWTANKGFVSAIAANTSQVVDVMFKSRTFALSALK